MGADRSRCVRLCPSGRNTTYAATHSQRAPRTTQPSAPNQPADYDLSEPVSWTSLGQDLWAYLNGRGAAINYSFVDMSVEGPRDTGKDAPRATWKLNGTLRTTTSDYEFQSATAACS